MDPINFNYSLKNIPISNNKVYTKCLLSKIESVIVRMRWRALFFDNDEVIEEDEPGMKRLFKSNRSPPQNEKLLAFEDELYEVVKSLEFKRVKDPFLNRLKEDVKKIKGSKKLLVSADKTNNYYSVSKECYNKLLVENITSGYKKADDNVIKSFNDEAKKIAKSLKLDDKMQRYAEKHAFITLKDHKPRFKTHTECRLLNPAKSEMGMVSKQILDNINCCLLECTQFNQWKNTDSVIKWFAGISDKQNCCFLKFDVVKFYPSISKELLQRALEFAKTLITIDNAEIDIIMNARKSLLFHGNEAWIKKEGDGLFDVTQGSYDGAEICELVGLYMLSKVKADFGINNIGLYRDDGLSIIKCKKGRIVQKKAELLHKIFEKENLTITVDSNLKVTDFLDVTLNLNDGSYSPFRKPNNNLLYINKQSNHPPNIIKQIPEMINNRISKISSSKYQFDKSKQVYEDALKNSGYDVSMKYDAKKKTRRNRKRKVLWFTPPFSKNVKTNVGKIFLTLISKHFPSTHKYHKIFNRYNVKVSYCCGENMEDTIRRHNNKILNEGTLKRTKPCNCSKDKDGPCPLNGECRASSIVYEATVKTEIEEKKYVGICASEFKLRYNNHTASFRHRNKKNATELSKYIWDQKEKKMEYNISWKILARCSTYKAGCRSCDLCQTEKFIIATAERKNLLNCRSELVSKCRHKNKFLLSKWK